jgi:hypothetical protein
MEKISEEMLEEKKRGRNKFLKYSSELIILSRKCFFFLFSFWQIKIFFSYFPFHSTLSSSHLNSVSSLRRLSTAHRNIFLNFSSSSSLSLWYYFSQKKKPRKFIFFIFKDFQIVFALNVSFKIYKTIFDEEGYEVIQIEKLVKFFQNISISEKKNEEKKLFFSMKRKEKKM